MIVRSEIVLPSNPAGKFYSDGNTFVRLFGDASDQEILTGDGDVTKSYTMIQGSVVRTLSLLKPAEPRMHLVKNIGTADCVLSGNGEPIDGTTEITIAPGAAVTVLWLDAAFVWVTV